MLQVLNLAKYLYRSYIYLLIYPSDIYLYHLLPFQIQLRTYSTSAHRYDYKNAKAALEGPHHGRAYYVPCFYSYGRQRQWQR